MVKHILVVTKGNECPEEWGGLLLSDEEFAVAQMDYIKKHKEETGIDWHFPLQGELRDDCNRKAQLAKVMNKRLDRPELAMKILTILRDACPKYEEAIKQCNESTTGDWSELDKVDSEVTKQLLPLYPSKEEFKAEGAKEEREEWIKDIESILEDAGDLRVLERQIVELIAVKKSLKRS